MSKNLKQAAEDVRALSRMFKGVTTLADVLDEIGSIEQLEREAKMRAENAGKAANQADALAKEAKSDLAKAKEKVKAAEDKAAEVVADAAAQAAKIVADAKAEADALLSGVQDKCLAANATLGEIHASIEAAQKARNTAEAECSAVEAKLAKIKAQVAKVLEA